MLNENWEFDVLNIYNYRRDVQMKQYFDFVLQNHHKIEGDIIEAGVFRGSALLAMGLFLKEIGSTKRIYGYDTFSGFPPVYTQWDKLSYFETQLKENIITKEHYDKIQKNVQYRSMILDDVTSKSISLSGDFSSNNLDLLKEKISMLKLDNIDLVQGPFSQTMCDRFDKPIFAVLFDCDLYDSYISVLNHVWEDLSPGGLLYFDEYYSLKFPGARKAVDDYFEHKTQKPRKFPQLEFDFERWGLIK